MPSTFRNTAGVVLLLVLIAGLLYAYFLSIPAGTAAALMAAFAVEAVLYLVPVFEGARETLERRFSKPALAGAMTASGVVPYLVYALPAGAFHWRGFILLMSLAAAVSFWYVVVPRRAVSDLLFVSGVAAVLLLNPFEAIYARPHPRLALAIFGQLMWTRLSILAALSIASMEVKGFGLWPTRREWVAGLRQYALFLPAGVLLGWALDFARFRPRPGELWELALVTAGTFAGMLWVVALREEFFFRGLLQQWFEEWTRSRAAALLVASVLFGLVHLPFRDFPNWRFALLATVAGIFYGRAYLEARSVRAAMVTHALVNTTWRMMFS